MNGLRVPSARVALTVAALLGAAALTIGLSSSRVREVVLG
jgi:hypothetical protein